MNIKKEIIMRLFVLNIGIVLFMSACHSQSSKPKTNIHEVVVTEVLQANMYTYLLVKENESEHWVALPKVQADVGKTYYYKGGFLMKNFKSKDLSRTFEDVIFIEAISSEPITEENSALQTTIPRNNPADTASVHKVVAMEVLQANKYTYLRVKENEAEHWVTLPKIEAEVGKTYYYQGGFQMTNFESKDLSRTFDAVLFIAGISDEPIIAGAQLTQDIAIPHSSKSINEKKEITVDPVQYGISIAELYSNLDSYAGKLVKIKGEVTKYNAMIMGKNWIHIQDGTDHSGHFDLTATTGAELKVGDVVSIEGKITLDKDFGYGYFYEVLMEDAKLLEK